MPGYDLALEQFLDHLATAHPRKRRLDDESTREAGHKRAAWDMHHGEGPPADLDSAMQVSD